MTSFQTTATIRLNGTELYYEIYGQGEPLIMIQGCGGNITLWEPLIESLSQHFQLILFDNRGMGRSQITPGDYTIQLLAEDTAALMNHLEIRAAHILGWSMGGMVAQELAVTYPALVNKLIIVASASRFPDRSAFIFRAFLEMLQHGEYESLARWHMSLCFSNAFFSNADVVSTTFKSFIISQYPPMLEGLTSQVAALVSYDRRGQLQDIHAPTLVLGAEEDGFFPTHVIHETAADIQGAKAQILPGSHLFYLEYPNDFSRDVVSFLKA